MRRLYKLAVEAEEAQHPLRKFDAKKYASFEEYCRKQVISSAKRHVNPAAPEGERVSSFSLLLDKADLLQPNGAMPTNEQFLKSVILGSEAKFACVRRLVQAFYSGTLPHPGESKAREHLKQLSKKKYAAPRFAQEVEKCTKPQGGGCVTPHSSAR